MGAVAPRDRATDLSDLLRASGGDLRASITAALAARERGGRLYARALVRPCAALAAMNAPPVAEGPEPIAMRMDTNDPVVQRTLARKQSWEAGCAQLSAAEWVALMNVQPDESGVPDPLLALTDGRLVAEAALTETANVASASASASAASASASAMREVPQAPEANDVAQARRAHAALLSTVMARPDGLLLDELGPQLLRRESGGYRFDGKVYASDDEQRLVDAALRLLPCEFGMACGEQDPGVWTACLQGDGCFTSRQAQVLAGAADRDERRQAEILALRDRLAQALRSQAVERF